MNKKGMGNIIATSLIIMITAFIGTMLLIWVTGFVKAQQYQALSTTTKLMDCNKVNFKVKTSCLDNRTLKTVVDNIGGIDLDGIRLRVYGKSAVTHTFDDKLGRLDVKVLEFEPGFNDISYVEAFALIKVSKDTITCPVAEKYSNIKPC